MDDSLPSSTIAPYRLSSLVSRLRLAGGQWPLVAILALAALLAAWLAALAAPLPRCAVGTGEDLGCARGFQTRETDGRRSFRWTDEEATVWLAGYAPGAPRAVEVVLAAPRPPDVAPPQAHLASSAAAVRLTVPPAARRYLLLLPGGPGDSLALRIAGETWVPPGDERALGVAVYGARALPIEATRLPGAAPALALLGLGLAAALRGRSSERSVPRPSMRPHPVAGGLLAIALVAGLWAWMPSRVLPFLPGLALVAGAWSLLWRGGHSTPRPYGVWAAAGAGALIDAALVAGALPGALVAPAVLAQGAATVAAVWWLCRGRGALDVRQLLTVALAVRLLGLGARLLAGAGASDPDTELFYNYGRAVIEVGVPIAEYPSGALLAWALLALPASRELFALLLPLLNLACDLGIVWAIWTVAEPRGGAEQASDGAPALALFYALSPLLLPFWHAKYDPLPAALLALGLAAFARGRFAWAGAALGLGGAIKWVPWLAAPLLAWHLLTAEGRGAEATGLEPQASRRVVGGRRSLVGLWRFLAGLALAVAAASLPFALRDLEGFLAPYAVQGARPLIGESLWFLPALLLEPGLLGELATPWSGVEMDAIPTWLMLGAQALALAGLWLALALRPPDARRALALAALAPAAFLLLNRVFSPQYALTITACALLAGAAARVRGRAALALVAALALMQACNLLVWPYTRSYWLAASAIMFAAGGVAATRILIADTVRAQRAAE